MVHHPHPHPFSYPVLIFLVPFNVASFLKRPLGGRWKTISICAMQSVVEKKAESPFSFLFLSSPWLSKKKKKKEWEMLYKIKAKVPPFLSKWEMFSHSLKNWRKKVYSPTLPLPHFYAMGGITMILLLQGVTKKKERKSKGKEGLLLYMCVC